MPGLGQNELSKVLHQAEDVPFIPKLEALPIVRSGIFFGLITTLFAAWGIGTIKKICTWFLPFYVMYVIYIVFRNYKSFSMSLDWGVSFPGILSVVTVTLPGIINLPTFFRHARSRCHGILALSFMTILVSIFQCASIAFRFYFSLEHNTDLSSNLLGNNMDILFLLFFISISTLCVNMVNVYFGSAIIETLSPNFVGPIGYEVIGLIGTTVYGLFQNTFILKHNENLTTIYIGCMGIMLLIGYLLRLITRHRPRPFEKRINYVCWFIGCCVATVSYFWNFDLSAAFISGIFANIVCFLTVLLVEETIWSSKNLNE